MDQSTSGKFELKSEFATVQIFVEYNANGPRLCIRNVQNDQSVYLDPLQLECITRMDLALLEQYLPY